MADDLYFLIEGGRALDRVKEHIAERLRTERANAALCEDLGVTRYQASITNGVVAGVLFDVAKHPDFKVPKPRTGMSYPKKGTDWDRRFKEQVGYDKLGQRLADEFGIPTGMSYVGPGNMRGSSCIGTGFRLRNVGFLYVSPEGPYALYCPDVPAAVAAKEADGAIVEEPAKSWRPEIDGARLILKQEWDLIVAEHELARARAKEVA